MAQKHLHELLKEDQEPFLLQNYIADRRCQLRRPPPPPKTRFQPKKRRPVSAASAFPRNLCKHACFFSFQESPDLRRSPLFEFESPARSPNAVFRCVPPRTAAPLLEAALRIHGASAAGIPKAQTKNNAALGLLGSILKKLKQRSRSRKREIEGDAVKVSVKDVLRWDSFVGRKNSGQGQTEKSAADSSVCEFCNGRPSSAVWSETNEDKSLDLETSSSSAHSDDFGFESREREDAFFACFERESCESPFRFVLQRSPSSGRRTPEFASPAASPRQRNRQKEIKSDAEEEEEKEQFSPVSVLDPPFPDDPDRQNGEFEDDDGGFDLKRSYAVVQRTKQQLLQKLRRFEKLAELDPIELGKRILQQEHDDYCDYDYDEIDEDGGEEYEEEEYVDTAGEFIGELCKSMSFHNHKHCPEGMKRLVRDLIAEEEREQSCSLDKQRMIERVWKRLESWQEVESNTIDMMVEQDLTREHDGWKDNQDQLRETALDVELAIFGLLVEELSEELVYLNGF